MANNGFSYLKKLVKDNQLVCDSLYNLLTRLNKCGNVKGLISAFRISTELYEFIPKAYQNEIITII